MIQHDQSLASKIEVVSMSELDQLDMARWQRFRLADDRYAAPFFSPKFSAAVQQCRGDVLVAILRGGQSHEDAIGYFPFHRKGKIGTPVGRFLNDAQNVIVAKGCDVDWSAMMSACGVRAFDLHAIISPKPEWTNRYALSSVRAFHADLGIDSQEFLEQLRRQHRTISKQPQKTRKMAREIGPLRLEIDCRDPHMLQQTILWKRQQYQRTHILDLFLPDWTRSLLRELVLSDSADHDDGSLAQTPLRGMLSVLWAGNTAVAAHIGMVERGRLYYWFPTYDPRFGIYSPGTALFTELIHAATTMGLNCIDMGYGEQPYKQKQTSITTLVGAGRITNCPLRRWGHHLQSQCRQWIKQVPMKSTVKRLCRSIFPAAGVGKLS